MEDDWKSWNAWYPIYTADAGWVVAFPWRREKVFWRYLTIEHMVGLGVIDPPMVEYQKDWI